MRITSGKDRSRIIKIPRLKTLRPTRDNIRQVIFDILQDEIVGKDVLDLFSGSGSIGLEAISRGARRACFVDNEKSCIAAIRENIELLRYEDKAQFLYSDVFKAIRSLSIINSKFDIIIMDPPYRSPIAKKALLKIATCDIIKNSSLIVVEHYRTQSLPANVESLCLFRKTIHGDTALSFYKA